MNEREARDMGSWRVRWLTMWLVLAWLVVWPAAGFPLMAKRNGAKLVIINREPTEQDDMADLVLRYDIGETLGPFVGN